MDSLTAEKDSPREESQIRSHKCGWSGKVKVTEGRVCSPEQMDRGQKDRGDGRCQREEAKVHSHQQGRRRARLETHSRGDWDQLPCPRDWHFPQRTPTGPDFWKGEESTKIT